MKFNNPVLQYVNRMVIASSILLNVILGGHSNQTFSARNYDRKSKGMLNIVWLIDRIFWFDQNHSQKSWDVWQKIRLSYKDMNIFR
jgi:hypothetical protein